MEISQIIATLEADKAAYDQAASDVLAEKAIQAEVLQKLADLTTIEVAAATTLNADVDAAKDAIESFRVVVTS